MALIKGGTGWAGPGQVDGDLHTAQGVGTGAGVGAFLADWALANVLHAKKKSGWLASENIPTGHGGRKVGSRPWGCKKNLQACSQLAAGPGNRKDGCPRQGRPWPRSSSWTVATSGVSSPWKARAAPERWGSYWVAGVSDVCDAFCIAAFGSWMVLLFINSIHIVYHTIYTYILYHTISHHF